MGSKMLYGGRGSQKRSSGNFGLQVRSDKADRNEVKTLGRSPGQTWRPAVRRCGTANAGMIASLMRHISRRPDLPYELRVFILHGCSPTDRTIRDRLAKFGQQAGAHLHLHSLRHIATKRLVNRAQPTHSLRKLLWHRNLCTMQLYARIHDETRYRQFKNAMSSLEAIPVSDWPRSETATIISVEVGENRTSGSSLNRERGEDP
jgi:site-specific recombinase XerC